jgi:ArsR family transcriptional regulator, arsenate/arsenite/antimonite-responsive transcriptional repressor
MDTLERQARVDVALSVESRVSVLRAVRRVPKSGLNVSAITERTGLSQPSVSRNVAILAEAGLVSTARNGRETIVTVTELGRSVKLAA